MSVIKSNSTKKIILISLTAVVLIVVVGISCWFGGLAASPSSSQAEPADFPPDTEPWLNLYLPRYTTPKHYDLTLYPDFYENEATFYGNVTITIDVGQAAYYLLVHYKGLTIQVKSVMDGSGTNYGIDRSFGYEPNQFWVVKTKTIIPESTTVYLTIQFSGSLEDGIVGFYKAKYANGTKAMATSKFEPVDARKAFPCFDEPNLKATFTTTLIHRPEYTALSNMPEDSTSLRDGLKVTKFQKSVPMSTYLACFIVCDCAYKNTTITSAGETKEFRVYAVKESVDQVDYALEFGAKVTEYFEGYFGLAYPLPKMDMIAIPDFVSGAMEHWGLITYRETNLLYKPGVSSPQNKQRIAEVVAHELAHQWFGNIVTMDWWDDLWLNEGFATFMAYIGTEPFEREMEFLSQFPVIEAYGVMPEDSQVSSHPIIVPVKRPEDITAVFDAISYNKGASVIRMLEDVVGQEIFKTSLKEYLKRYQYGNAKTFQLWQSVQEVTGSSLKVELMMDTWTKQAGFPLVTAAYNNQSHTIVLSQELFKADTSIPNSDWPESPYDYKWVVPVKYATAENTTGSINWLQMDSDSSITVDDLTQPGRYFKLNYRNTGYYIVNYDTWVWNRYADLLSTNPSLLSPADRAGLLFDSLSLARSGYIDYSTSLNLLKYLSGEDQYVPWYSVYSELFTLRDRIDDNLWKNFVTGLVNNTYEQLTWNDGGTHLEKLLRLRIVRLACAHDLIECLEEAKHKLELWLNDPSANPIDAGIRLNVFTYGMKDVSLANWDIVWTRYENEQVATAKSDIRNGLCSAQNAQIIDKLLSFLMDKSRVSDQDFFTFVNYIAGNKAGLDKVWTWAVDNYDAILASCDMDSIDTVVICDSVHEVAVYISGKGKHRLTGDLWVNLEIFSPLQASIYAYCRFGLDNRYFGRMIPRIADRFSTADRLAEVERFYAEHPEAGSGERARKQSIEAINDSITWRSKYKNTIINYLSKP